MPGKKEMHSINKSKERHIEHRKRSAKHYAKIHVLENYRTKTRRKS